MKLFLWMRQTRVRLWPSEVTMTALNTSQIFVFKSVSRNRWISFQKKDIIIQSSATYISWIDLALGIISLKRKTNKLKPDTLLQRRVSCTVERNFSSCTQSIRSKMAKFKKNQAEKLGLETPLNYDVMSHAKKETYNNSGVKRDFGFFFFFFLHKKSYTTQVMYAKYHNFGKIWPANLFRINLKDILVGAKIWQGRENQTTYSGVA